MLEADQFLEQFRTSDEQIIVSTVVHVSWAYALGTTMWIMKELKINDKATLDIIGYELSEYELTHGMWCQIELPTILSELHKCQIDISRITIRVKLIESTITSERVIKYITDTFKVDCETVKSLF